MENQELTVIVWCLTYNQKEFIKDSLDGFVMQKTTFPFEVVVHDDASTDGTTDIVMEYARKYPDIIKPVVEKENQWQKGGLKHIIQIMNKNHRRGRYIAFCEGDDYWTDPHKLQKQVEFLETNQDYSMCFHSAKKKYETDTIAWIDCEHIHDKDYDPTDVFVNWTVPTASVVCRKEAMDFYAELKNPERIQNYDIFIILSCAMVGKIRGMHEQMSVYRIQGGGLTYNKEAHCGSPHPNVGKEGVTMFSLYTGAIDHQASFIRRELALRHFYDERYKIVSDWKFFIEALVIDNCTFQYTDIQVVDVDSCGISNTNYKLDKQERENVLKELFPQRVLVDYRLLSTIRPELLEIAPQISKSQKILKAVIRIAKLLLKLRGV